MTAMLNAGWSPEQLCHVITSHPLPRRIRTSVDAIVAARLRSALRYPPPAVGTGDVDPGEPTWMPLSSTTAPAARTQDLWPGDGLLPPCFQQT